MSTDDYTLQNTSGQLEEVTLGELTFLLNSVQLDGLQRMCTGSDPR